MLQLAGAIVEGEVVSGGENNFPEENPNVTPRKGTRGRRIQAQTTNESSAKEDAINRKHDPSYVST
jgi:hypothetical protein